jgi:aspartyl-tRNA synthetase
MARYGSDKPDMRFGLEIHDVTAHFEGSEFNAFRGAIEAGGVIRGLNAGSRELSRAELDGLVANAQELGAKGLVWAFREGDGWRSPVAKFLGTEEIAAASAELEAGEGDLLLLVADAAPVAARVLGVLRLQLAERFELVPEGVNSFCWIVDWPLFEWNDDEKRWDSLHHPFTSPLDPDLRPRRAAHRLRIARDRP